MSLRGLGSSARPRTSLGEAGVVCHDLQGFSDLTMDLVRLMHQEHIRVAGRHARPVLLLANDILTVEFQVQLFASHPDLQRSIRALAIVGTSFMLRHLTSMFLSYHAPDYPVKRFDTREEAQQWLAGRLASGADKR